MRKLLRRLRHKGDAGLSLLEIVIAMFVFSIVSIAAIHSLISVLSVTRDSRNREIAANLAAQEIDLARDAANIFSLLDGSRNIVLNGETFTVTRTTGWVSNPNSEEACGQGGGILKYKRVEIEVDWEHKRAGSDVVHANTVISPGTRINNPQLGTILVSVEDGDGNGSAGVTVSAVPLSGNPNGAQSLTASPAPTDAQGCTYILQVVPGNYVVTVSKTNYIKSDQTTSATQTVTVAANNSASASFAYDLRAQYQLAYYSSPAPFAYIPRDLDTTFVNTYGVTYSAASSASFTRTIDRFPWTSGYSVLAGKYIEATESSLGCLSPDPAQWPDGVRGGNTVVGTTPLPIAATAGGFVSGVVPMGLVQISGVNNRFLKITTAPAGGGDPGCAITMTYRTNKTASDTIWLALPYGSWKIESNPNDVATGWTTVNTGAIVPLSPGQILTPSTFMLDPREVP